MSLDASEDAQIFAVSHDHMARLRVLRYNIMQSLASVYIPRVGEGYFYPPSHIVYTLAQICPNCMLVWVCMASYLSSMAATQSWENFGDEETEKVSSTAGIDHKLSQTKASAVQLNYYAIGPNLHVMSCSLYINFYFRSDADKIR